jgi:hypothetical protein
LLRDCFARPEPWLQAGKYLSALAGGLARRNGWTIAEHAGDRAPLDQVGPVLDLLQLALDDPDQAVHVGGGEVGDGPLEQRPDALGGIEVRRAGGQPVNAQPGRVLLGEVRELGCQVDVEVIPDPDQRGGQLPVGGDDQVPVIGPGEEG